MKTILIPCKLMVILSLPILKGIRACSNLPRVRLGLDEITEGAFRGHKWARPSVLVKFFASLLFFPFLIALCFLASSAIDEIRV
jgi:hypothetical protein